MAEAVISGTVTGRNFRNLTPRTISLPLKDVSRAAILIFIGSNRQNIAINRQGMPKEIFFIAITGRQLRRFCPRTIGLPLEDVSRSAIATIGITAIGTNCNGIAIDRNAIAKLIQPRCIRGGEFCHFQPGAIRLPLEHIGRTTVVAAQVIIHWRRHDRSIPINRHPASKVVPCRHIRRG